MPSKKSKKSCKELGRLPRFAKTLGDSLSFGKKIDFVDQMSYTKQKRRGGYTVCSQKKMNELIDRKTLDALSYRENEVI